MWCPELAKLPAEFIHNPWEAPTTMLAASGCKLVVSSRSTFVQIRFAI